VLQSQESKTTSKDLTDIQANKKLNSENSENIMVQRREKTKRTILIWRQIPTKEKTLKLRETEKRICELENKSKGINQN